MRLSGQQCKQLQSALIDAFPTTASLEQMLAFELDKSLRAIAGEGSLQDIVFRLIQVAESQGWLEELIRAAHKSNPGNAILRDIAQDLMQNYLKTPRFELFGRKGSSEALSSAKHSQIRDNLLEQVRFEVESRINSSLHNRVYIVLDVAQNPQQIELPWASEIKVANQPKIPLEDTNILTVFDRSDVKGRLLILGQPGSGKTAMLLKLAEALVSRANNDLTYPVPVLFSLSSWKNDNQNIKDWLLDQLKDKYGLRKDIGKLWINNQKVIPLLDGLDELVAERQEKCVLKINQFLHPSSWINPVIVCSRIQEYQRYTSLLQLNSSLELYPFSPQQVYQYLKNTDNLQLWDSISHDADLSQLAKTPLLLNIIVLSAQEISIQTWQRFKSSEERLSYLFNAYIRKMGKGAYKGKKPYLNEKTERWLSWLAQRLIEKSSTEFFIERMQSDWLKDTPQKIIYSCISSGVTGALIFGLIYGEVDGGIHGVIYGVIHVGIHSLIYGLIYGLIDKHMGNNIQPVKKSQLFYIDKTYQFSLAISFTFILFFPVEKNIFGFDFMIPWLLMTMLFGYDIKPIEISDFSRKNFLILISFMVWFVVVYLVLYGWLWHLKWINVVIYGLVSGLIIGLNYGIESREIEHKTIPNQGVCQSITNTILISIMTFFFVTLVMFLIKIREANIKLEQALIPSLVQGLFFGLLIAILGSGIPAIKHFVLRIILWFSGYIPCNYAKFLDYCTNRLFLQRVGGGYRFMHDLLRQHFAKSYK